MKQKKLMRQIPDVQEEHASGLVGEPKLDCHQKADSTVYRAYDGISNVIALSHQWETFLILAKSH